MTMAKENEANKSSGNVPDDVWNDIRGKVESLKYGSVIITVHDGKVTQVEVSSKIRY